MNLENLEVIHKTFGHGVIESTQGKYITVKFNDCTKTFVYPDSFEKFLTLADGSVSEQILADISSSNEKKQQIIDKKNEENLLAMTKGIVIPGKEIVIDENDDEENRDKSESEDL